ncbi:MAG: sulfatase-like hydrolase/transferase [Acidobacteria bacterium]|nr:sulfatase-like hydrolase/transferase [Acidobacteriota bacterium]
MKRRRPCRGSRRIFAVARAARRLLAPAARRLPPLPAPLLILAAVLGGAALGALGCARRADRSPEVPQGTPVVLISIDTLRADHLPAYGYRGVDTPAIDALRADAVLFARAYTQTPLTLPSHTALLTGLLPAVTGVRDNVGYSLDAARVAGGELPYLPFILKQHGYATGGAVSAYVLQGKTGLGKGFDFYEDSIEFRSGAGLGGLQRPGTETLRLVLPWLRAAAAAPARPFFLFFHIYEPHTPYDPPEPYASRYPLKYDGEIATADAIVGRLLDELRRAGAYDRAIVVLLSDHGEGLGDHGEDEHGVLLYNEAIHVPLLLKLPRRQLAGRVAGAPVALTDVAPTLLGLLGLPVPAAMRGTSLLATLGQPDRRQDGRRVYSETFYPRLHFGWSDLASLAGRRYHTIEGPDPEVYDLDRDPHETHNLLRDQRRVYAEARRELAGYDRSLAPPQAVDAEARAAMTALGYVGRTGAAAGPLPDPKAHLDALRDLKQGFAAMAHHDYRLAAGTFERLLQRNPQMADGWEFLGRAREKLDDPRGALAAYGKALSIDPGSAPVAIAAASLYLDLGELDQAENHARIAAAGAPSFAHGLLAQIAMRRGKLDLAEREARAALDEKGRRIRPMITLAEVLHARHRYEDALAQVRQAEGAYAERTAKDPELIEGLSLIRGKILADLGDAAGAEAAFRQEIQSFPEDLPAYPNLAILDALTGRPEAARDTLRHMVDAHPSAAAYAEAVKTLRVLADPSGAAVVLRYARRKYPNDAALAAMAGR